MAVAFGPASAATASQAAGSRSVAATLAPSRASSSAVARPMPLAAPVTIATRPAIERERVGTGIVMGRPPYYTPSPQRKLAPLTVYDLSGKGDSGPCSRGGGEACLPDRRFVERAAVSAVQQVGRASCGERVGR